MWWQRWDSNQALWEGRSRPHTGPSRPVLLGLCEVNTRCQSSNPPDVWPWPSAPVTHDTDQGHITYWPPGLAAENLHKGNALTCSSPHSTHGAGQGGPPMKTPTTGPSSKSCGQMRTKMTAQTHELRLCSLPQVRIPAPPLTLSFNMTNQ